jgi:hemolysin III
MSYEQDLRPFSITLFLTVNLTILGLIFGTMKLLTPNLWHSQLSSPWLPLIGTFITFHLLNAFVEYFFHRYVLHAKVIPGFGHFYDKHNQHHDLTKIEQKILTTNKFPIIEEVQNESSFFPWWTFLGFASMITPLYILLWVLFPTLPIFTAGYFSLLFSIALYELFHMVFHLPLSFWGPKFNNKKSGRIWKTIYTFHLRHHANVSSNESISGFFGIPLPDFLFGTYMQAKTLFPDQTLVPPAEYQSPRPYLFIRSLDKLLIKK